ncbi:YheC/YheD family protein [Ammoniphilus sp. YIM 78166]|uniref:YheC/YheD family endospore coat-associated protein n=1 Tax=Ammoniphilus sp. YIM 78166 TaxID=1644106 RepID=UPI00106F8D64|nr:YheC/YheD family protein [Ammoniphilus sp. YIM 78166]
MNKRVFGIMTDTRMDFSRFQKFVPIALNEGFSEVVLFTPNDVDLKKQRVLGYVNRGQSWKKESCPFPSISHDVGYYTSQAALQRVKRVKAHPKLPFLGYGLGNKWTIQQQLSKFPSLLPHLLPTILLSSSSSVLDMLKKHRSVMLKPVNGKGGRGIIRLTLQGDGSIVEETGNQAKNYRSSNWKLPSQVKKGRYLVQKWIDIRDRKGTVYDIRVLMQKDGSGKWTLTGMGVRQGSQGKITSNLSGGGHAFPVYPFLKEQFSAQAANQLERKIREISYAIPDYLEKAYNKRLVDLGLDIAVDRDMKVWIIEVNIKPGKTLYKKISDFEADRMSLVNPIKYARYLLDQKK